MAALTTDRATPRKEGKVGAYPVAANARIYAGGMVCVNAQGYAVPASDAAGLRFVGVAREGVDNTGGANGARRVEVYEDGVFQFAAAGMSGADVGAPVFVVDDQTVGKATANAVGVGSIESVESATAVWVNIHPASRRVAAAQANSAAADVATLVGDFNALLAKLRAAGLMAS